MSMENNFQKLDIKVNVLENQDPVKALVLVIIDDVLAVRSIRIIKKEDNYFVAMPCFKTQDTVKNYVYCINKELQKELDDRILTEYRRMLALKGDI